jgi:hypothetical protein
MNGLEAYDRLKASTSDLPFESPVDVEFNHSIDLRKLTSADLVSRDYSEDVAEKVSHDLSVGKLDELGKSMGLRLHRLAPGTSNN